MNLSPFLLLVTVLSTTITVPQLTGHAAAAGDTAPNSRDILLNCGSSGRSNVGSFDNRTWLGDVGSEYSPTLTSSGPNALFQSSSVSQIPYMTARIFTSQFTYSFPLGPGRKFLRLYFYPTNYSTKFYPSDAIFKVTAGSATLLNNFSTYQTSQALKMDYFVLEYSVNVSVSDSALNVTFVPSTDYSNSYALVNGIEVMSIPDIFSISNPTMVNGKQTPYTFQRAWAMQTVYRLNVGGQPISPTADSGELFRSWDDDSPYIYGAGYGVTFSADPNVTSSFRYSRSIPSYIAPREVYLTGRSMGPTPAINLNYNLTWILTVDAGFYYLVRMHFCEDLYPVTKTNMRVFNIYINNITAQVQFDAIVWTGGIGRPCFLDFVVITTGSGLTDLWVALQPDVASKPYYYDAILNGLEVFKLENPDSNLAGQNPKVQHQTEIDPTRALPRPGPKKPKSRVPVIADGVAGGAAVIAALLGCCLLFTRQRQRGKKQGTPQVCQRTGCRAGFRSMITPARPLGAATHLFPPRSLRSRRPPSISTRPCFSASEGPETSMKVASTLLVKCRLLQLSGPVKASSVIDSEGSITPLSLEHSLPVISLYICNSLRKSLIQKLAAQKYQCASIRGFEYCLQNLM